MADIVKTATMQPYVIHKDLINRYINPLGVRCPRCGSKDFYMVASAKKYGFIKSAFARLRADGSEPAVLATRKFWYSCRDCGSTKVY